VDLNGRVALVTGAARGIGSGIARELARAGADVAIADIGGDAEVAAAAAAVADEVRGFGRQALTVECDVSDESQCVAMVEQTVDGLGGVDVVVCNAGIAGIGKLEETSAAQWERVLAVNATGTFLTCSAALPHLLEQGRGSIVNIASVLGLRGGSGRISYAASKFAVVGLTQALAGEVAARGVRVNCICPSSVRSVMTVGELMDVTGMTEADQADALWSQVAAKRLPLGRSVEPEDIGRAVVWLCESDMVTGVSLPVTGGDGLPKS
jgi:meso-butanediol dehydrogenase/(S,S)-butanediol dehydrogenase/diacetyl reductase